ncbi:MAG TPA: ABC transporter permease, partial [Flavilitoribacter sp.]|nr:ABC transporter permease [Flavilitoribacter sp.]
MKTFIAFVRKEILHILRDRRTLLILIGMPIVQVLLFGFAVTNEFKDANMAVLDLAKDDLSKELTVKLAASGHFTNVGQLDSYSAVHEAFKTGEIKLAVVIPGRFSADFFGRGGQSLQL